MLLCASLVCLCVGVSVLADVTFDHVTVMGGSKPVNIISSNSLSHYVPEKTITHVHFHDKDVLPILYTDSFSNLLYLQSLDLGGHRIKEIRRGAFSNLPLLTDLILDNNELDAIYNGVFTLTNLTRLSLSQNSIKNISSSAFDKLYNLSFLFLAGNQLKSFDPDWFNNKPFLFLVDLNDNQIEEIPEGAFDHYHNSIFLGGNQIQNLSRDIFGKGKSLRQLSLHDNQIQGWDEDFLDGILLNSLDVSSNKIECLEGNYSEIFAAQYTFLGDNPWDCECLSKIVEFDEWAEKELAIDIDLGTAWKECNVTEVESVKEE